MNKKAKWVLSLFCFFKFAIETLSSLCDELGTVIAVLERIMITEIKRA